ncbi:DUF3784 domain-containing protein [Priestia flexa]|uniref:DUF3784 domain-containing protein n=1 Tax=Priestia flexa TaxID=86664 RepID=UPI0009540E48|nr:DUF3784 domain-containing protein [Priestia flexa]SIQ73619.1 protein of unknown function [Priestia flexa]
MHTVERSKFIGVKKQTWLLSGYNQQRVRDKDKLARLVGAYNFIMGMMMLGGAFISHPDVQILFPILIIGYLVLLGYVNTKMVE